MMKLFYRQEADHYRVMLQWNGTAKGRIGREMAHREDLLMPLNLNDVDRSGILDDDVAIDARLTHMSLHEFCLRSVKATMRTTLTAVITNPNITEDDAINMSLEAQEDFLRRYLTAHNVVL